MRGVFLEMGKGQFVLLVVICFLAQNLLTLGGVAWYEIANARSKAEFCLNHIQNIARGLDAQAASGIEMFSDPEFKRSQLQETADGGKPCRTSSATVLSVDVDGNVLTIDVHINGYWNHWSSTVGVTTLTVERVREEAE